MAEDKRGYAVDETPAFNGHQHADYVEEGRHGRKEAANIQEAGELYGDLATAEEYGYVVRG